MEAKELAKEIHDFYEERSLVNEWKTQDKCKVEFDDLPPENKQTMLDVASFLLAKNTFRVDENLNVLEEPKISEGSNIEMTKRSPVYKSHLEQWQNARQITKDQLIKELREKLIQSALSKPTDSFELRLAKDELSETKQKLKEQTKWISVEDELPNTDRPIIMYGEDYVMIGFYFLDKFRDALNIQNQIVNITHWQPLPEPPKQ